VFRRQAELRAMVMGGAWSLEGTLNGTLSSVLWFETGRGTGRAEGAVEICAWFRTAHGVQRAHDEIRAMVWTVYELCSEGTLSAVQAFNSSNWELLTHR